MKISIHSDGTAADNNNDKSINGLDISKNCWKLFKKRSNDKVGVCQLLEITKSGVIKHNIS